LAMRGKRERMTSNMVGLSDRLYKRQNVSKHFVR
jgi:hypothetical protein